MGKNKPHFNPENIYERDGSFIYIDEDGDEHDVTHLPVWWKCEAGHGWEQSLFDRVVSNWCPECFKASN